MNRDTIRENTIFDIIYKHRATEDVFREYDVITGDCVICDHMFDRLGEFCDKYTINFNEIFTKLERAVKYRCSESW